jgi:hypothetical protein
MAYIGQGIKQGTFKVLDTSGNTYNGSNTTFSLGTQVGAAAQLLVSHDGVIQKPGTDYTLASGGASITFSTAPASGASIFIVEISGAVGGTVTPSDNSVGVTQLNLSDGSSGQFIKTDGSGTLSFASVSNALDDITTGDAAATLATSAGNITIDAQGGDTDIIFKGTDSSTDITALTIDMSDGGVLQTRAGIGFPATQVANSGGNVLDDYEEGVFTGGFSFGGSSTGISYNRQVGIYTKIGDLVFVQGYVSLTSKGSQTGTAQITGLPFTSSSATNASSAGNMRVAQLSFANDTHLSLSLQSGEVALTLGDTASGAGATSMDNTNFADNTGIEFACTYTV